MKKDIVLPDYNRCILSTITSILKYYNVETSHKSLESLDKKLSKRYKNVIFLVLDGMGEHILNNISENGYFNNNKLECITSVYPSSTTSALTTYYSGKTPYETGWIAWSQYFKEYGRAIDMFKHKESYLQQELPTEKGDVFKTIVNYETIFEKIEKAYPNVKAYEIEPTYAEKRFKRSIRADNIDEIINSIEMLCKIDEEKFLFCYSDKPDNLLHYFGTKSDEVKDFVKDTENKIQEMIERIPKNTILVITADHGHKDIKKVYRLNDYPEIQECLYMPISLEARVVNFCVKCNMEKEFEERFNNVFKDEFYLMTTKEFLEKNFLGYGSKHAKIDEFLGNYIALSTSDSMIQIDNWLTDGKEIRKSTHGGLTKEEMEVPVIVINK